MARGSVSPKRVIAGQEDLERLIPTMPMRLQFRNKQGGVGNYGVVDYGSDGRSIKVLRLTTIIDQSSTPMLHYL